VTRIPQGPKKRGSQHWLQVLANGPSPVLEAALPEEVRRGFRWLSPLRADEFAEYRDDSFLELVGLTLDRIPRKSFWPARGPVWDGLAVTSSGTVLMVEAKANLPELQSPPSKARPRSALLIRQSLDRAKGSFGAPEEADWSNVYYQYANRLAWLHLLRAENGVAAYLLFLYFSGASEVAGPASAAEWLPAIDRAHRALRLGTGPLTPYALDAFVDVATLADA